MSNRRWPNDAGESPESLVSVLCRAARAFVREAEQRAGSGGPLTLDHCEVLRGLVLAAAVELRRDPDELFKLLGQPPLLKNRNHHRALRRELDRVREFVRTTGATPEPALARVLAEDDDPGA